MTVHQLKCWTDPYLAIRDGSKGFEYRLNDRDYNVGDTLVLNEWNTGTEYTGRVLEVFVTYILKEGFGIPDGYCIMSISRPRIIKEIGIDHNHEWSFAPIHNEAGVPIQMAYECPHCGSLADYEYDNCPNPFCKMPLDPD